MPRSRSRKASQRSVRTFRSTAIKDTALNELMSTLKKTLGVFTKVSDFFNQVPVETWIIIFGLVLAIVVAHKTQSFEPASRLYCALNLHNAFGDEEGQEKAWCQKYKIKPQLESNSTPPANPTVQSPSPEPKGKGKGSGGSGGAGGSGVSGGSGGSGSVSTGNKYFENVRDFINLSKLKDIKTLLGNWNLKLEIGLFSFSMRDHPTNFITIINLNCLIVDSRKM